MNPGSAARSPRTAPAGGGGAGQRRAKRAALGNDAPLSAAAGREGDRRERRDERIRREWAHRTVQWQVSSLERVRKCGRVPHGGGGAVLRVSGEGGQRVAGFAGLVRCASPWACLGCASRINAEWSAKVEVLLAAVRARGGGASFVTLTARHHRGQGLRELWDGVQKGYEHLTGGRPWARIKARFGVEGQIRVLEVTDGPAGWHPHLHLLILHDTPVSQDLARCMGEAMFDVYAAGLARVGLEAVEHQGGLDVQVVDLGDDAAVAQYLNKIGHELVGEHTKTARRLEHYTAFGLLEEFRTTGNMAFLDRWHEYERASHRRKRITTSRGLFHRYGVSEARSDEEIVESDEGGEDCIVLPADTWAVLAGPLAGELRIVAERDGRAGAAAWLTARRLAWSWATPAPRRRRLAA